MEPPPSRRDFLKVGCGGALAAVVACSGLGMLAARAPEPEYLETLEKGVVSMKKILVTYATRAGSTVQVAERIAETMGRGGLEVDLLPVKKVASLAGYDGVVLGSAIRMGQWLPEAVQLVKTNRSALAHVPIAYFLVSGYLRKDTPDMRQTVLAYVDPVREILEPASIGLFAGKIEYAKLSFMDRTLAQLMKEPEGDWRNWDAIGSWARDLQALFPVA